MPGLLCHAWLPRLGHKWAGGLQGKKSNLGALMMVAVDKNTFSLVGDIPSLLERAAGATIQPMPEDKGADVLNVRNAQVC